MAAIFARTAEKFSIKFPVESPENADDKDISGWARDAVYAMQRAGVIHGKDNNLFDSQGSTKRGEAAKVMYYVLLHAGMIADEYLIG